MFISTTPHSLRLRTTTSHHPLMKHPIRKLLNEYASRNTISPSPLPSTLLRKPITSFDTSMILTILFIVTALLFLGFFSVFIGRFSGQNSIQNSRRRRLQRSSPSRPTQQVLEPPTTTVGSLPVFAYDGLNAKKHTDCPVCLGEFQEKELVKLIPYCGHVFHSQCIDTWLSSHVSCPLCRTTQFFRSPSTKKKDNPCLSVLEELQSESREV